MAVLMRFLNIRFLAMACAWLLCWDAYAAAPLEDSMAQRTLACTACHGEQGRAGPDGYYPRLAGKPAAYLYNQLQNFRTDRRHYPLMAGLLDNLSDAYLRDVANYFSALSLPYPAPLPSTASAAELQRGRQLALEGEPKRGLPACTQCHGQALTGTNPATPGLLGLPADYLNAQLGGWQTGQRHAIAPDCMTKVVQQLSDSDINAVSRWLAAQPVPANAHAVDRKPADADKPSLICGSDTAAAPKTTATPTDPLVARGAYLARIGNCALCHSARGGQPFAGGRPVQTPFGAVYSSNITPDASTGLGAWTADDFWRALHHGEAKDGRALYPAFPYTSYTHLSRADSDALFAFLKSLTPVSQANKPHTLRWPYNTQLALKVWRTLYFKADDGSTQAAPAKVAAADAATWQRGRYLVEGLGHCLECHGARNFMGALSGAPGSGSSVLPDGQWLAPAFDDAGGASVASWSEADVATFLQTGRTATTHASGPMAEVVLHGTQYLNDADARAIGLYLKALPQRAATIPVKAEASATVLARGKQLYEKNCSDCHADNGQGWQGGGGAYPALAGNRAVMQTPPNNLINSVLAGGFAPATAGHPQPYGMPPFLLRMGDAELAALLSYVRNAWGNQAPAISEFDINKFRRAQVQ